MVIIEQQGLTTQDYVAANAANTADDTGIKRETLFLTAKYLRVLSCENKNSLAPH
jgi:hypothetical protein